MEDSFEEHASSEQVAQNGRVCSWCGKPETRSRWSGTRFSYCSFRCLAAAEYRTSLLVAILMTPFFLAILLFPQVVYEIILVGATPYGTTSPLAPGFALIIVLLISGSSIGSLYAAYVGWTLRRRSDTVFIGDMPDTQLYPRQGQYGDTGHRCEWCGNTKVSASWSGKSGIYCSLRCSAAGDYRRFLLISVVVFAMTSIVGLMAVRTFTQNPGGPLVPPLILLFILLGVNLVFAYPAYLGWSMNRTARRDETKPHHE
ncbi:MAG: hypothetical protein AM324_010955 [Candidatus Thorarchaeota archaeon SMTZ1-83]|nr:MAG: hypothetical protein AM324_12270 [Candidatus Thorarchaeota archaeon SMTZ1-83]